VIGYLLRRVGQGLLVVLGVTLVVFVVTRVLTDPVDLMLPLSASEEQRQAFAAAIGLDRPLAVQLLWFLGDVATLDLGDSLWQRRPAAEVVFERLPFSLLLIGAGLGLAVLLSVPLAAAAALRPGGLVDRAVVSLGLLGLATPQFFLGLLLIMVFAVQLRWLPTSGTGTAAHLLLPALTLALTPLARFTLMLRSAMVEEMSQPYAKVARAKGLAPRQVIRAHVLRNVSVPFLTLSGWELVVALSGYTVVVETVFAWPGMGFTAVEAIKRGDLFLMQAIVFVVAFLIVLINVGIDVLAKAIDPRIALN
jgi:peptide/nickel transport system permease protein